jgi:hypothetical protein
MPPVYSAWALAPFFGAKLKHKVFGEAGTIASDRLIQHSGLIFQHDLMTAKGIYQGFYL